MTSSCPLCNKKNFKPYFEYQKADNFFKYYECNHCSLVFMDKKTLLEPSVESLRYEHHKNDVKTPGYEKFLRELVNPVLERVSITSLGLDYGSGPYPMLSEIVEEDGYQVEIYDPYFANDKSKLDSQYDFITCCEVAEHFYNPNEEFQKLYGLLKSNGILGVRTGILTPEINFKSWFYKEDDTHVVFYTPKSINWICEKFKFENIYQAPNVFILKKATSS